MPVTLADAYETWSSVGAALPLVVALAVAVVRGGCFRVGPDDRDDAMRGLGQRPSLAELEREAFMPISATLAEGYRKGERQFYADHPDARWRGKPAAPAWPSYWCDRHDEWHPADGVLCDRDGVVCSPPEREWIHFPSQTRTAVAITVEESFDPVGWV